MMDQNQTRPNGSTSGKSSIDFVVQLTDHQMALAPFALKLTRDTQEANDLVQETLLKALLNKDKFRVDSNLRAWLMTIMKNTFINRTKRARRSINLDPTNELYITWKGNFTVENLGPSRLSFKEILKLLQQIEGHSRRAFLLHVLGYKYDEIAERLGVPLGTVKVRIHRTRKTLRRNLKP